MKTSPPRLSEDKPWWPSRHTVDWVESEYPTFFWQLEKVFKRRRAAAVILNTVHPLAQSSSKE